ncbi:MAG: NAD-dependent epimerase/dehydratase family protein [Planctomycetes bacterium]|nr:NAD-dependent epimerase/dehydratase family protein [Planctomycetota bacterium]NOG54745.1 NAD-dependent epimerase/dehydratase family protein [Planctomycetota bacterium]
MEAVGKADTPLKLLILGGTGFLGPHTVRHAAARGHTMTLFNRGRTNSHLFPDLEHLHGDRDPDKGEGLKALEGGSWDAVIDTSSYYPRATRASAGLLAETCKQYVLISSISVYADHKTANADESYPLGTIEDETVELVTGETYGPLKVLCEKAAEEAFPGRTTNIRPGLIVGPGDPTDRFSYWPIRVRQGGEVLAPGAHDDPVQYIDARDLAAFIIHCIEQSITGPFNAVGPEVPSSIGELLCGCKAVTGGTASFTWADAEFLAEQGVQPWNQMTVWVPPVGDYRGMATTNIDKALANGMTCRPLADTARDFLAWWDEQPAERRQALRAGLPAERETEVLEAWHSREN